MMLYSEGATPEMETMANNILESLTIAYPNYPWAVNVYGDNTGGGFFIRNLDFPSNWGMNQPKAHKFASSSELKRDVIMKAGEWLERANLKRGRGDGSPILRVDGVPAAHQPPSTKPSLILTDTI